MICPNCNHDNEGAFCSACGQAHAELHKSVRVFLGEAFENFIHFDSKILGTLTPLFFQPGKLSEEYLAGKRVRYVPPFRLYVSVSFVFFLLLAMRPYDNTHPLVQASSSAPSDQPAEAQESALKREAFATAKEAQNQQGLKRWFNEKLAAGLSKFAEDPEKANARLSAQLISAIPKVTFILVPCLAAFLLLLFRRERPYYVDHLVVALHLHVVWFAIRTVGLLLSWRRENFAIDGVGALLMIAYGFHAVRRVYGTSFFSTLWRGGLVAVQYGVCLVTGVMLVLFYDMFNL